MGLSQRKNSKDLTRPHASSVLVVCHIFYLRNRQLLCSDAYWCVCNAGLYAWQSVRCPTLHADEVMLY